jgi:hypothetical protein
MNRNPIWKTNKMNKSFQINQNTRVFDIFIITIFNNKVVEWWRSFFLCLKYISNNSWFRIKWKFRKGLFWKLKMLFPTIIFLLNDKKSNYKIKCSSNYENLFQIKSLDLFRHDFSWDLSESESKWKTKNV